MLNFSTSYAADCWNRYKCHILHDRYLADYNQDMIRSLLLTNRYLFSVDELYIAVRYFCKYNFAHKRMQYGFMYQIRNIHDEILKEDYIYDCSVNFMPFLSACRNLCINGFNSMHELYEVPVAYITNMITQAACHTKQIA